MAFIHPDRELELDEERLSEQDKEDYEQEDVSDIAAMEKYKDIDDHDDKDDDLDKEGDDEEQTFEDAFSEIEDRVALELEEFEDEDNDYSSGSDY